MGRRMLHQSSQHRWCNVSAAAQAMPATLLVASTRDRLLPPNKHSDIIAQALQTCEKPQPLTYLKRDFGWHGFALEGWRDEFKDWLQETLVANCKRRIELTQVAGSVARTHSCLDGICSIV